MHHQVGINTVFRRYNIAVVVAFIVIILLAFSVASLRYLDQLAQHKTQSLATLKQEAQQLNLVLEKSVQAVVGIKDFAQYLLNNPAELSSTMPALFQRQGMYYLDKPDYDVIQQGKRLSNNLTGIGQISEFSTLKRQEITMANALTPAFVSAQNVINEATWFYYTSFDDFINIYPWVDKEIWRFNEKTLSAAHYNAIKKLTLTTNRTIWSSPYLDATGGNMNSSVGTGVFHQGNLLGAVVIDINLSKLHDSLAELNTGDQGVILFNQENEILLSKRLGKASLNYRSSWQELLPQTLKMFSGNHFLALKDSQQVGDWLIEKQVIPVNGWTLLKYQKYETFSRSQYGDFIFVFAVLFIGLLAFLMLINFMTKRTFIKPTTEFISHIEYCAEGDPGKIKPTSDWLHWFQIVEDIFAQNRSLLLQLKEQNDVLDSRVIEKTQALQETSAQHQRDYALLRSVMDAIPELIVFNDPHGNLMGCNQAFERLTKARIDEMLGEKSVNFLPIPLAKELERLNTSIEGINTKATLITVGESIYQGFSNQFSDEHANVLGSITLFHDVTIQQSTQSALEKAKNQAEYANKVKIQFLANMSHEVRTPINAMQGLMDLLAHTTLDSRQLHYLNNAKSASTTLLHLVDELLDLSKIEAGKMVVGQAPVNLPSIIDKALKLNITSVDHTKVSLLIDMAADVPSNVLCDEMRLVQVLANLFNNAIKFTERGQVKLKVDAVKVDESSAEVSFSVTDTGIGIAKDKQSHLFNAFSQADESMTRRYGGSGLGLSICQQIIKLMGGEITLTSEFGKGSELSFILPFKRVLANALTIDSTRENTNESPELRVEVASTLVNDVCIYHAKQGLTVSLGNTITRMAWNNIEFEQLQDINLSNSIDKKVLLLDEKTLIKELSFLQSSNKLEQFDLLCICQYAMRDLAPAAVSYLKTLTSPYLLLDLPLFRYSLDQIALALTDTSANNFEQNERTTKAINDSQEGATFEHLVIDNELANDSFGEAPQSEESLAGLSVLLVEDNLVNQLVAKELLLSMDAQVTIADNGQRALDILTSKNFDVIFMDIQMPIMDGLTAAKEIRKQQQYQSLPIIAMTAHARNEDSQQSLDAGMNLHIAKPVTGKILYDAILTVIKK